jgi:hypothetical protein
MNGASHRSVIKEALERLEIGFRQDKNQTKPGSERYRVCFMPQFLEVA